MTIYQMLAIFICGLLLSYSLISPTAKKEVVWNANDLPACRMQQTAATASLLSSAKIMNINGDIDPPKDELMKQEKRIIVIGDVHGSNQGLKEILYASNITSTLHGDVCEWRPQGPEGTLVIQVGDIVDRGGEATEAWQCLDDLQVSAPQGSSIIRLVGNHEVSLTSSLGK